MSHQRKSKIVTPKDEWGTPQWLFDLLDQEFHFATDAAASYQNTKKNRFFHDALIISWDGVPGPFFLNPPYSAALINAFMKKAYEESLKGALVVCLVPVSGDRWWIDYALKAQEIRYIRGRVKFVGYDIDGNQVNGSPMFSSCVVIFDGRSRAFFEGRGLKWEENPPRIGMTIEQPKKPAGPAQEGRSR